ncbi:MAG: NAD(P)/FAD-dependent oxidoreductase [Solirubrobacteraceae bacterium]|nr:NAD(P)/FAD-dependent oxidoreductase [Solirubrobacteraceae bacterium]
MPVRATKRGPDRTPLHGRFDVLICGASFAGLAAARELAGSGADVLVIDRYEIGERQTSACAAPTAWLENLGLEGSIRQTFSELVVHVPQRSVTWPMPYAFSTFDYRVLCELLAAQGDFTFETAKVEGIRTDPASDHVVVTDRGELTAPLVVDALGWRRSLGTVDGATVQPPEALLSRGLEVHSGGAGDELALYLDARYVRAGYGWSFPAGDEVRVGVGSFVPRDRVKDPTVQLAADLAVAPEGFQGNWIPHALRRAVEGGVFFAGDSAGHCLPATAEGIRTALYFGLACGRELRAVVEGRRTREQALARYGAFSDAHARPFRLLKRAQDVVGHIVPRERLLRAVVRALCNRRVLDWFFARYMSVAPPEFALATSAHPRAERVAALV